MNLKKLLLKEFIFFNSQASEEIIELWAEELKGFSFEEINKSLAELRQDPDRKKPPFPSEIKFKIFNFPDANQAWATMNSNENDSIFVNEEMRLSFGDCFNLLKNGDIVAARMAFIKSYERRCKESVSKKIRPKWSILFGQKRDEEQVKKLLNQGISENKITREIASKYLLENNNFQSKNILISRGNNGETCEGKILENLNKIKLLLENIENMKKNEKIKNQEKTLTQKINTEKTKKDQINNLNEFKKYCLSGETKD